MRHHKRGVVVDDPVREHVERGRSTCQERSPPPTIIFGAELEVAHDDGDFRTRDDENDEDERQEAKYVVELLKPDASEDEEQLDEHRPKRKHASDENGHGIVHVPRLRRDLAWNLIRSHRFLQRLSLETQVTPHESQRDGDTEPQEHENKIRSERDRTTALLTPDKNVQHRTHCEDDARIQQRSLDGVHLPSLTFEHTEQKCADETIHEAHDDVNHHHSGHEPTSIGG